MQSTKRHHPSADWTFVFLFTLVLATAAAISLVRAQRGLPFLLDPDESAFVEPAVRILTQDNINPHWFGHPGTVTIYLMSIAFAIYGQIGIALGWFSGLQAVVDFYSYDPSSFHLIGRVLIAASFLLSLVALFQLSRLVTNRWIGLLSLCGLTFVPSYVLLSASIRTDIQQTICVLLTAFFAVKIVRTGGMDNYLLGGTMIGIGSAIKYPTASLVLVIIAATAIRISSEPRAWKREIVRLSLAGTASVVTLFCCSPFLFLDYRQTLHDLFHEARSYHLGATSEGFLSAIVFYLTGPLASLTILALPLSLLGIIRIFQAKDRSLWVLLLTPAVYLMFISLQHLRWARWAAPLAPFLALFSVLGVECIYRAGYGFVPRPLVAASLATACALWLAVPAVSLVRTVERSLAPPPIAASQKWVLAHIPPGSKILAERYTAQLPQGVYDLYGCIGRRIAPLKQTSRFVIPTGALGDLPDLDEIRARKIEYVLLGNDYDRRRAEPVAQASSLATYRDFFAMSRRFGPRGRKAFKVVPQYATADSRRPQSTKN